MITKKSLPLLTILCILILASLISFADISDEKHQQEMDLILASQLGEISAREGTYNFFGLVEELIQGIIDKTTSKQIKQDAIVLLADLKKLQSEIARKLDEFSRLIDEAIDILNKFIADPEYKNYDRIVELKFEIPELMQRKALVYHAQKIEGAESIFEQTKQYLEDMIKYYQTPENVPYEDKEKVDNALARAYYVLGLNYYFTSRIYIPHEEKHRNSLQKAITVLKDLIKEHSDKIISFDAADYVGLCYFELKDYETAELFFRIVADLTRSDESREFLDDSKEIIQKGYVHLAMLFNAKKGYRQAIQKIEELLKLFPKNLSDEWMEKGIVEKNKALYYAGQKDEAIRSIQKLIEKSKHSSVRFVARAFLNDIDDAPPEVVINAMRNLIVQSKFTEAIQKGRKLLIDTNKLPKETRKKYLPELFVVLGDSFRYQNPPRFYEAIIFYEAVYLNADFRDTKDNKNQDIAALAAYNTAITYRKFSKQSGDETDREKYKETLKYLVENWPNSNIIPEIQFTVAEEYEEDNKYLEAAEAYSKVAQSSGYYYESRYRLGIMFYRAAFDANLAAAYQKETDPIKKEKLKKDILSLLSRTEEKFKEAIALFAQKQKDLLDDETKSKIRHYEIMARIFLSRVYLHDLMAKYTEALELLNNLEKTAADRIEIIAQILSARIDVFIKVNNLVKAEGTLRLLKEYASDTDTKYFSAALQSMALSYEKIAGSIIPSVKEPDKTAARKAKIKELKEKSRDEYDKFANALKLSSEYYRQWVEAKKEDISPEDVLVVAEIIYQTAEDLDTNELCKYSADFIERLVNKEFSGRLPKMELWIIEWKLAKSYRKLNENIKALQILDRLDNERKNNIDIKRELALTYKDIGSINDVQKWEASLKKWIELNKLLPEQSEGWWEAMYHIIQLYYDMGEFKTALYWLKILKNITGEDFGSRIPPIYRDKIQLLEKNIEEKTGKK